MAGLIVGCSLTLGCGDPAPRGKLPRGDIAVIVNQDGKPLTAGRVDLHNVQTGEGGGGDLNGQGIATLSRIVEGIYVVTINPPFSDATIVVPGQPVQQTIGFSNIPEKFRKVATSPLQAEVKQGETGQYRFDLKEAK